MSRERKPRYIITMEPKQAKALERYSVILGVRPSSVIKQLIEQAMDRMDGQLGVIEHLAQAKAEALENAASSIETGLADGFKQLGQESASFFRSVSSVPSSATREESGEVVDTLSINKGVRSNKNSPTTRKPYIFTAVDNTGEGNE